jgi:hypothetical protein
MQCWCFLDRRRHLSEGRASTARRRHTRADGKSSAAAWTNNETTVACVASDGRGSRDYTARRGERGIADDLQVKVERPVGRSVITQRPVSNGGKVRAMICAPKRADMLEYKQVLTRCACRPDDEGWAALTNESAMFEFRCHEKFNG